MSWACLAPAKVNLTLHVGQLALDGYHPLESLAVFADVGDEVRVRAAADLSLTIAGPFAAGLSAGPDNLVLRAAQALAAAAGVQAGAAITLEKRLPIAAGLGGGSADAAAALRALARLWDVRLPQGELEAIAAGLGADGAVCVACRPALMRGRGERLAAVNVPALPAVLVNPGVPSPTGDVYRQFDARGGGADFAETNWSPPADADALIEALAVRRNDLEAAAIDLAAEIGAALAWLKARAGVRLARLSGSGATTFALVDRPETAAEIAAAAPAGWWARPTWLGAIDAAARLG